MMSIRSGMAQRSIIQAKIKIAWPTLPCPKIYLEEQYFQVKLDDTLFDYHLIKAGMPQGGSSGPYSTYFILLMHQQATTR
jgi:hypothetical protein